LGLKSQEDWKRYNRSGNRHKGLPVHPERKYKNNWVSWGDFLGTGFIAPQSRQYRSFEQAKKYVYTLGLQSKEEWSEFSKSKKRPRDTYFKSC
jgi:hypothetical protein